MTAYTDYSFMDSFELHTNLVVSSFITSKKTFSDSRVLNVLWQLQIFQGVKATIILYNIYFRPIKSKYPNTTRPSFDQTQLRDQIKRNLYINTVDLNVYL